MKRLPLYLDTSAAIEHSEIISDVDKSCSRCRLGGGSRSRCLGADGQRPDKATGFTGAVLVLGDHPSAAEDNAARPVSHGPNAMLRTLIEKAYSGPVVYATAIRCAPGSTTVTETSIRECRGYTHGLINEIKPSRILCFGKNAYWSVLGSSGDSIRVGRKGYGYLSDGTPVFMLHSARRAAPNRFLLAQWTEDVKWALEANPELPPWDGKILEIETQEDAERAVAVLEKSKKFTFDTECGGLLGDSYFQVVCLTATPSTNLNISYLWTEEALKTPALLEPLRRLLANPKVGKIGHSLKHDFEFVAYGLNLISPSGELQVKNAEGDTFLWMHAEDTECKAALDYADHRVGMGGHKAENAAALDAAVKLVNNARANPTQRRLAGHTHPALVAAVRHPEVSAKAFAYALVPRDILYRYCALDTIATARLAAHMAPKIAATPYLQVFTKQLVGPPTEAIAQMEAWGMSADITAANMFGNLLRPRKEEYLDCIRRNGCTIDIGSPAQLSDYLFNTLKLPVQGVSKKTQQPSTDAETLTKLVKHHPVIKPLMDYAKVSKLLSTYVDGLIPHIREDGRIRSSFNLGVARSGRLSCVAAWTPIVVRRASPAQKLIARFFPEVGTGVTTVIPISTVKVGDLVLTHKRRWRRVTATIVKGVERMYSVQLANGSDMTCTLDHRVYSAAGAWEPVRNLRPGSALYSPAGDVCIDDISYRGQYLVYDLTVEEDHSYLACGVYSHNSSDPNLQNIPSAGEYAKIAKNIFNCPPGHVLIQLDYSQIEVRIAAMLSRDPVLIQAYVDGVDVHRRTAATVFHKTEAEVTKEERRATKAVVFGVMYGKSPQSLANDLGVSLEEGRSIYDGVLGGLKSLNTWMQKQRDFVQRHGYVWSYIPSAEGVLVPARRRQLWQIAEPDSLLQSTAKNGSVNTPIQGSASDFMIRAVVAVIRWVLADGIPCRVVNTVHDNIMGEVPYAYALEVANTMKSFMEGMPSCGVPLVADVDIGRAWGAMHSLRGIMLVADADRRGYLDSEIVHLVKADSDLNDEMGDDPTKWLKSVRELARDIAA